MVMNVTWKDFDYRPIECLKRKPTTTTAQQEQQQQQQPQQQQEEQDPQSPKLSTSNRQTPHSTT